jgi:hypothetical protein
MRSDPLRVASILEKLLSDARTASIMHQGARLKSASLAIKAYSSGMLTLASVPQWQRTRCSDWPIAFGME